MKTDKGTADCNEIIIMSCEVVSGEKTVAKHISSQGSSARYLVGYR